MDNDDPNIVTIPKDDDVDFPSGSEIVVCQIGGGATSLEADAAVSLNGIPGGVGDIAGRFKVVAVRKRAPNEWVVYGAVGRVLTP